MEDTKNKSLFRGMWNLTGDGEQDNSEDFDVYFQNYSDKWFDDFMEFFSMCVETREHFQHPKYTFSDIEDTRTEGYMHEKVHPALHTIIWNMSWYHADLTKEKLKK